MSTLDQIPTTAAAATTARYRAAAEAKDIDGVLATMTQDVVLHSPITEKVTFNGAEEMRELLGAVFETITEVRFFADVGDERTRALFFRAMVGRQPVEEAALLTLTDDAAIADLKLFMRPLPGLATVAAELGPRVTERRHGPLRALVGRLLLAPLGAITRIGDRFVRFFV